MRDLEELEASVRDPLSRPHFREAARAFRSGAYRAAVVEAWVAVARDLTNKIRGLADTGDGQARAPIHELDRAIEARDIVAMQKHERTLLSECEEKFEFLTSRECAELRRLFDDRNLCAHPAFIRPGEVFAPSAELVRGHLASAVDCALALPPISGKKILESLQRDIVSKSWPRDEDISEYLRDQYFNRTRPTVCLNLTKIMVKGAVKPTGGEDIGTMEPNELAYRCRTSVNAIYQFQPKVVEEAISAVVLNWERTDSLTDRVLLRFVGSLGHLSASWISVSAGTKLRVIAVLEAAEVSTLIEERTFASGLPEDVSVAAAYGGALAKATAGFENLETLVGIRSLDDRQWVGGALDALRNAESFRSAERRLRCLLRLAPKLSVGDLASAAASIRENKQIYQASDTPGLLLNLYGETAATTGARAVWLQLAQGLHDDYMQDHADADGQYSYKELLDKVMCSGE